MGLYEIFLAVITFIGGVSVGVIILMVILPIFAAFGVFVNKAGETRSGFHLFTGITPGQVKIVERGDIPVRFLMKTPNKKFARSGDDVVSSEYWTIKDAPQSEAPTADVWIGIRWWAHLVYKLTGKVFTGIYPFQKVREYRLGRTILEVVETPETASAVGTKSNLRLTTKIDFSDHFRTYLFQFPIQIKGAESKDKIPLDIIGIAEIRVEDPFKTAYGTERWDLQIKAIITDAINAVTRTLELDQVLTASTPEEARRISKAVLDAAVDSMKIIGMVIEGFRTLEINPQLDENGLKKIQAEAFAKQQAKATREDAQARADGMRSIAAVTGSKKGQVAAELETRVKTAEAAGKGGIVLMGQGSQGTQIDPVQLAQLALLKKLAEGDEKK